MLGDRQMVNKEKVKSAIDDFENEKHTEAKETIKAEIRSSVNDYLKDKLGLKNDPIQSKEE